MILQLVTVNRNIQHHSGKKSGISISLFLFGSILMSFTLILIHLTTAQLSLVSTALGGGGGAMLCFCHAAAADDTHRICSPSLVPRSGSCLMSLQRAVSHRPMRCDGSGRFYIHHKENLSPPAIVQRPSHLSPKRGSFVEWGDDFECREKVQRDFYWQANI